MQKNSESRPRSYRVIPSSLGDMGVVWVRRKVPSVIDILLPGRDEKTVAVIADKYPDATEGFHEKIDELSEKLARYLEGEAVRFSLELLNLDLCYDFQKRVLLKVAEIPPGRVISYGGLAEKISAPSAARAVGTALARNLFPVILPCHRVVRSNGHIGQFGGGPGMKKRLLELEGIGFDDGYMIDRRFFW